MLFYQKNAEKSSFRRFPYVFCGAVIFLVARGQSILRRRACPDDVIVGFGDHAFRVDEVRNTLGHDAVRLIGVNDLLLRVR